MKGKFSKSFEMLLNDLDRAARAITDSNEINNREEAIAVKSVLNRSVASVDRKHKFTPRAINQTNEI